MAWRTGGWSQSTAPRCPFALRLREARQVLERPLRLRSCRRSPSARSPASSWRCTSRGSPRRAASRGTRTSSKKTSLKPSPSGHVDQRPDGDARRLHVDQEVADAPVLRRVGVSPGEQEHAVGVLRLRRPDLLAVDDKVVAVHGQRASAATRGPSRVRLAEPLAPDDIAGGDARQVLLLLFLSAVQDDRRTRGPTTAG